MPKHGTASEPKPSAVGGFGCLVCGREVEAGEFVVGFFNENKPKQIAWDHVCARPCAGKYRPPPIKAPVRRSTRTLVKDVVSGAWAKLSGQSACVPSNDSSSFLNMTRKLEFSDERAREVLAEYNGDESAALQYMATLFVADHEPQLDSGTGIDGAAADGATGVERGDEMETSSDEELPPAAEERLQFDSKAARAAVYDVFHTFVVNLLPKPQTDGSFKDGDPSILDTLMTTPCTLALPRAERLSDLIKPQEGWDEPSMQRSLAFFGLAAAGVQFLIFIPTITHRKELARSPLFQVKKNDEVVGIRDCCPCCRSNRSRACRSPSSQDI